MTWRGLAALAFILGATPSSANAGLLGAPWSFEQHTDQFTDESVATLTAAGSDGRLAMQIRCTDHRSLVIAVLAVRDVIAPASGRAAWLDVRADDRPVATIGGAGKFKSVQFDRDVQADFPVLARELGAARLRFLVRIPNTVGELVTDSFSAENLGTGLKALEAECRGAPR